MWCNKKIKGDLSKKEQKLQDELLELRLKYASEINSYCKIKDYIFILKAFNIEDGEVRVVFVDSTVPGGYEYSLTPDSFHARFGSNNFKLARVNFLRFEQDLEKIGLKLEKI